MKIKDVSLIFKKAMLISKEYKPNLISKDLEKLTNIWCRLDDDTNLNWYSITKVDKDFFYVIEDYGYLSRKFPISILMKNCPKNIRNLLYKNGILCENYCERYSCEEEILKNYVDHVSFIDDSFLYDENIPFNQDLFLKIDEGINYINPNNFLFEDIL